MNTDNPASSYEADPSAMDGGLTLFVWRDKPLAALSIDLRTVWQGLAEDSDHSNFSAAALIWLLRMASDAFAEAKGAGLDSEMAWGHVGATVLAAVRNKILAKAKVLAFMRETVVNKKGMHELMRLAIDVLKQADESEIEPPASASAEEEASQGKAGLATGEAKRRQRKQSQRRSSK